MICDLARISIENAGKYEKDNAVLEYGPFHSQHEAWAVLKEEVEEMASIANRGAAQSMMYVLWLDVKCDKRANDTKLQEVYDLAKSCACEAVQVMAMVEKWRSYNECKDEKGRFGSDEAASSNQDGVPASF